jgi:hypothetical protein
VVADVHTHPGGYGQSGVDQANPMIPETGHLALIVPNFADRAYGPGQIGVYEIVFQVPDNLVSGDNIELITYIGGVWSNASRIAVQ